MNTISFIGAGNVAWHLAPALDNVGFAVREVYSRKIAHAEALVKKLYHGLYQSHLDFSQSRSEIFIIAVSDDSIEEVVKEIVIPEDAILVHTSGSQPLGLLQYAATSNTGVFYPLQTFSKDRKIDLLQVPFFIEASNKATGQTLVNMAKVISKKVIKLDSEGREALHVAAVFASNFTNHLLSIAKSTLADRGMSLAVLAPLIRETVEKSLTLGPEAAQTGPAKRKDLKTLDRHFEFLKGDRSVAEIYRLITQHIIDTHPDP